jgi:hypothetical protein
VQCPDFKLHYHKARERARRGKEREGKEKTWEGKNKTSNFLESS